MDAFVHVHVHVSMCTSIIQVCARLAAVLLSPQMYVSAPAHVAMRLLSSVDTQSTRV